MLPSPHNSPILPLLRSSTSPQPALGFGDLCRYFYRALKDTFEDDTAHDVTDKELLEFDLIHYFQLATHMIECWKRNKYLYSDLEEMFLINMQHNQDRELLARELGCTLGDDRQYSLQEHTDQQCLPHRESFPEGVSRSLLVNSTIEFFNTEPSVREKLNQYREKMEKVNNIGHNLGYMVCIPTEARCSRKKQTNKKLF